MPASPGKSDQYQVEGHQIAARPIAPGLYLVATPVGNLGDMTLNALNTLASADYVLCEDTRVSSRLFSHYGIATPLRQYQDHNAARVRPKILADIKAGKRVALISDAGTPLISDPGYKLVSELLAAGQKVQMMPGASAPLIALALSGLPSDHFQFIGFLPAKSSARKMALSNILAYDGTTICFESAKRIVATLQELARLAPDGKVAIARELTKKYEEVIRGTAEEIARQMHARQSIKGEITLLITPPERIPASLDDKEVEACLRAALSRLPPAQAAGETASVFGLKKRDLYPLAVKLKQEQAP